MSRHRKREKHAERDGPGDVITQSARQDAMAHPDDPAGETSRVEPALRRRSKLPLIASIVLLATWFLSLILLVMLTANPIVVNFQQIEASDHVVTARLVDPQEGQIEIENDWKLASNGESVLEGTIRVKPLKSIQSAAKSQSYLIPLRRVRGRYEITPQPGPRNRSPIYPATPDAQAQLEKILEQVRSRKG